MDDEYFDDCDYDEFNDDDDSENSENSDPEVDLEIVLEEDQEDEDSLEEAEYKGLPYLTKFEKTRILGIRASQIEMGADPFVETNKSDPYEIALQELLQKKTPLFVRRTFGKKCVDIDVNTLEIL